MDYIVVTPNIFAQRNGGFESGLSDWKIRGREPGKQ